MLTRKELAIDFMEDLASEQQVEIYNIHAENGHYEKIWACCEENIEVLVSTEGKNAYEIFKSFDKDFSTDDAWMMFDSHTCDLVSFDDATDYIELSEIVDAFYESKWCQWNNGDFHEFVHDSLSDDGEDEKFLNWFEDECDSSTEWEDTEDLHEMYQEWLEEENED